MRPEQRLERLQEEYFRLLSEIEDLMVRKEHLEEDIGAAHVEIERGGASA